MLQSNQGASARGQKKQDEVVSLQAQLTSLQSQLRNLQSLTASREEALEILTQEKETLKLNLKKQERYNRTLKQQLEDERFFYQKEIEYFYRTRNNSTKRTEKSASHPDVSAHLYSPHEQFSKEYRDKETHLMYEHKKLVSTIDKQSEVIYNLCIKFFRMKQTKDEIASKLLQLHDEYLKVVNDTMNQLDNSRNEINMLIDERFQDPIHPENAIFIQVLQRNSRLMYENSELRLEIQKMKIRVDGLTPKSDKEITTYKILPRSHKNSSTSISSYMGNTSGGEKIQKFRVLPHLNSDMPDSRVLETKINKQQILQYNIHKQSTQVSDFIDLDSRSDISAARTQSAPEILQCTKFKKLVNCKNPELVDTRECCTNT